MLQKLITAGLVVFWATGAGADPMAKCTAPGMSEAHSDAAPCPESDVLKVSCDGASANLRAEGPVCCAAGARPIRWRCGTEEEIEFSCRGAADQILVSGSTAGIDFACLKRPPEEPPEPEETPGEDTPGEPTGAEAGGTDSNEIDAEAEAGPTEAAPDAEAPNDAQENAG